MQVKPHNLLDNVKGSLCLVNYVSVTEIED